MDSFLSLSNRKKALLIINPVAGRKVVQRYVTLIVRRLMDQGYAVTTAVTADRGEARWIAAHDAACFELLVCAGGDGTLNECLSGLADADLAVPLGYIPCGSTNDFALTHGLSTDIPTAVEALCAGRERRYDLGCFGDRVFIHQALFGAFTWMAYSTDQEQKNKLGYGAYILDGLRDLSKLKPLPLTLTADGVRYCGDYLFGAISTDGHIAGIYDLPEDRIHPSDGKLAAVLIKTPKNVLDWDMIGHSILTKDPNCPMVEVLTADCFTAETPEGMEWSLDGENSGARTKTNVFAKKAFYTLLG